MPNILTLPELRKLKPEELEKEFKKAILKRTQAQVDLKTNQDKKSHLAQDYKTYCAQIRTVQSEVRNQKSEEKPLEPKA